MPVTCARNQISPKSKSLWVTPCVGPNFWAKMTDLIALEEYANIKASAVASAPAPIDLGNPQAFADALAKLESAEAIQELCDRLCDRLFTKGQEYSPKSRSNKLAPYSKLVKELPVVEGITSFYQIKQDGSQWLRHLYYKFVRIADTNWAKINSKASEKVVENLADQKPLDADRYEQCVGKLLASEQIWKIGAGLIATSGRRPVEIVVSGKFEVDGDGLKFGGQAKKRDEDFGDYYIPLIGCTPELFVEKLEKFRSSREIKNHLAKVEAGEFAEGKEADNVRVQINRLGIVPTLAWVPVEKSAPTCSDLRAAWVAIVESKFKDNSKYSLLYRSEILGHNLNVGSVPALNYSRYAVESKSNFVADLREVEEAVETWEKEEAAIEQAPVFKIGDRVLWCDLPAIIADIRGRNCGVGYDYLLKNDGGQQWSGWSVGLNELVTRNDETQIIDRTAEKQEATKLDKLPVAQDLPACGLSISFGWTCQYLPAKTVTRRDWEDSHAQKFINVFKRGDRVIALDKDKRYGGQQIGWCKLMAAPYKEKLADMPESDLLAEGGMCKSVSEFIDQYFKGDSQKKIWVIRFEFEALPQIQITVSDNLPLQESETIATNIGAHHEDAREKLEEKRPSKNVDATAPSKNIDAIIPQIASRHEFDFYETPPWLTLLALANVPLSGTIGECCVGHGAIASILQMAGLETWTNDIDTAKPADYHSDVTLPESWQQFPVADWIVTNPPYAEMSAPIVKNAYAHTKKGVVMILRQNWMEGCDDRRDFLKAHPPTLVINVPRYCYRKSKPDKNGLSHWATDQCPTWIYVWEKANQSGLTKIITLGAEDIPLFHRTPEGIPSVEAIEAEVQRIVASKPVEEGDRVTQIMLNFMEQNAGDRRVYVGQTVVAKVCKIGNNKANIWIKENRELLAKHNKGLNPFVTR
jgi:hypothetical protein